MVLDFRINKINGGGGGESNLSNPLNFLLRIDRTGLNQTISSNNLFNLLTVMSLTPSATNIITTANVNTNIFNLNNGILKLPYFPNVGNYKNLYCDYTIDIRLTGTISGNANTSREFLLQLRRADDSLIEGKTVIKINDNNLSSKGIIFETYTSGELDPFIVNGLKLQINNTSTQIITLTGATVLVKGRTY